MQNQGTRSRLKRLASRLKGRPSPITSPALSQDNQASHAVNNDYDDRQRVQIKYEEAANDLKEAIKIRRDQWGSLDFEELSGEPEGFDDSQFKNKINAALISRETSIKDRKGWSKFTNAVECVFSAFSPFAKNFLMVAKDAQAVMPFSRF